MTQIEYIRKLIPNDDKNVLWLEKTKGILNASDVRNVYETFGEMFVRDVLANSKIHRKSLAASHCCALGLDELIQALERLDGDKKLLCYGFASDALSSIGNCYVTKEGILIGCAWLNR